MSTARDRMTVALLWLVLVAALVTAPIFLFAEGLDRTHVLRVLESNGVTALLCAALLAAHRRKQAGSLAWIARLLVLGLFGLISWLAWSNGEPVHVNVINFVFVTVLASALRSDRELLVVAAASAAVLCAIALRQTSSVGAGGESDLEARLEPIGQFLPTYVVTVAILWMQKRRASRAVSGGAPPADAGS